MKSFVLTIALFFLPLVAALLLLEGFLTVMPGIFNTKRKYLKSNMQNIEILVLGSSHMEDALNPERISCPTASLAFGGQDLNLDSKILRRYAGELPGLKVVLLELAYHTLEYENNTDYWRNSIYLRYDGITTRENNKVNLLDHSLYFSNADFYHYYLLKLLNPSSYREELNQHGFVVNVGPDRFPVLKYDSVLIEKKKLQYLGSRHKDTSITVFERNSHVLKEIIGFCHKRNVTPVLVAPPVYRTYAGEMLSEKLKRRDQLVKLITNKFPGVEFWNYEQSSIFNLKDFKNDDHLGPKGTAKFSAIIDERIRRIIQCQHKPSESKYILPMINVNH